MKAILQHLDKMGKKLNSGATSAISLGKKVAHHIHSVGKKVLAVADVAKEFVPEKYKDRADKALATVQNITDAAGKTKAGLGRADNVRKGLAAAAQSRDLMGGAKLARDAYYETKKGLKNTREVLSRGPSGGLSTTGKVSQAGRSKTSIERQR